MGFLPHPGRLRPKRSLPAMMWKYRWHYFIMIPGLLYFAIYKYWPIIGTVIVFQDFQPNRGFFGSPWVGFQHFLRFFGEPQFWMLLRNTLILALYNLVFFFPAPIILALLLNEVLRPGYKKIIQTLTYMPHFLSWVVIVGISFVLLSSDGGIINTALEKLGFGRTNFLMNEKWFRPLVLIQTFWKDMGWGSIIFLAALSGVNQELYESAKIEGANRLQQLWHITLPSIRGTIITMFILRLGTFLDLGYEQIYLMLNAMNRNVGEVFDTYIYRVGVLQGQFSYTAAVGLFKSVVSLILVISVDRLVKKLGEEGIY